MARPTLAYFAMSFFIISSVFSAGSGLEPVSENPTHPFRFVKIEEICHKFVIEDFGTYFNDWIVAHLQSSHQDLSPEFLEDLDKELGDHKTMIENYLNSLVKKHLTVPKYSNVFLEVEVEDLLKKIGEILKNDYRPKYQSLDFPDITGRINDFKKVVEETPLDTALIGKVANLFRPIYEKVKSQPKKHGEYDAILPILVDNIKSQLKNIISTYLGIPNNGPYDSLTENDKVNLETFYEKFKFLLDQPEIRSEILKHTIGQESEPEQSPQFFKPDLFSHLKDASDDYKPIFVRDNFIVIPKEDPSLEDMHMASKKSHFSPQVPALFDSNFDDIELGVTKSDKKSGPENQAKRSKAKLELMLYKIYTMARKDGTIPYEGPNQKETILEKLFDWIVSTKAFDTDKPATTQGDDETDDEMLPVINVGTDITNPERKLISPEKFQTYFVPLLNLICEKLGQTEKCKLFEDKSDLIAEKFKEFENVLLFNDSNSEVLKLVPPTIVKELKKEATKRHFGDFKTNLDNIIVKAKKSPKSYSSLPPSEIDNTLNSILSNEDEVNPDLPEMLNMRKKSEVGPKRDLQEEIDDEFEQFAEKFLPTSKDSEPEKIELLETLIKTAGASENNEKKNFVQDALVNYIVKQAKKKKIDIENSPLVEITAKNLMTRLLIKIKTSGVDSIRNFMNYHLLNFRADGLQSEDSTIREITTQKFYDLAIFAYIAAEQHINKLKKSAATTEDRDELNLWVNKQNELKKNLKTFGVSTAFATTVKKLYVDPANIKRINSFNFFNNFLDFFTYFKEIQQPNATYGDYNLVYLNFYNFLLRIRVEINDEVLDPYTLVYTKLNDCLQYTSRIEMMYNHEELKNLCVFSHRKYAEMLFFYKTYVIVNDKPGHFDLAPFPTADFNTHVRLFLSFMNQNSNFSKSFAALCNQSEESICKSWDIFEDILYQLSTFKTAGVKFTAPVYKKIDHESFKDQMSVVNAFEAISLVYVKSNNKDYEKLIRNVKYTHNGRVVIIDDAESLADYLARTFRKLEFTHNEIAVSSVVKSILANRETLIPFLKYSDNLFFDYIKIFLLFANSDAEFKLIADLLVENQIDLAKLAFINSPDHDTFYSEIISGINALADNRKEISDQATYLRSKLQERYSLITGICTSKAAQDLVNSKNDVEELDELSSILDDLEVEMFSRVDEENKEFDNVKESLNHVNVVNTFHVVEVEDQFDEYERNLTENGEVITSGLSPNKIVLKRTDSEDLYSNIDERTIAFGGVVIPDTDIENQQNHAEKIIKTVVNRNKLPQNNDQIEQTEIVQEQTEATVELQVPEVKGRRQRKKKLLL